MVRKIPEYVDKKMHIDGMMWLEQVENYDIIVSPSKKDIKNKLSYFDEIMPVYLNRKENLK